jgi:NADH-quinone oxidoreductase subunit N
MSAHDFVAMLPLLVTAGTAVLVMLAISCYRRQWLAALLTALGLAAALVTIIPAARMADRSVTLLLRIDDYALFFLGLLLAAALVVTLFSYGYLKVHHTIREEYYILLLLATVGAGILVASTHFASLFLGLEILSVSLYAMIAQQRTNPLSIEAGIKYLTLAGASSAFILFGMALIYMDQGTMYLYELLIRSLIGHAYTAMTLAGIGMILTGVGFKLALAPFHLWTPDVYQGAPAPVTAFIATCSKGAMFALLLRFFSPVGVIQYPPFLLLFTVLAIASMTIGNILALLQTNVKRLLAYSSIAHMGYLLVAFLAGRALAVVAVSFYLVAYFIMILGAFGVMSLLYVGDRRDADELKDYRGLAWSHPWLAGVFSAMLLSLAGLPLTAGFIGKFLLLTAGVRASLWALVIILVLNSGISIFYYLRLVRVLYQPAEQMEVTTLLPADHPPYPLTWLGGIALAVLSLLLIWLGVYPTPLIQLVEAIATRF